MRNRISSLLVIIVVMAMLSTTVFGEAPRLINYQGRVLTAGGGPVANGPHTFDFRIYDGPGGGATLLWTEGGVVIVTTNALFTHILGCCGNDFPSNLFVDGDELWLDVTVDAQLQTPRTRLVSTPYAETAGNLSLENPYFPGTPVFRTSSFNAQFSTYGSDGLEQIRLWGPSWGEIMLFDGDPTNDETVRLTANPSFGGQLSLRDNSGNPGIELYGGLTGDVSAYLPIDAVNSSEMLDEPGVASEVYPLFFFTPVAGDQKIDSVDIMIPGRGYVEITAGAYLNMWHITGTRTEIWVGITKVPPLFFTDPGTQVCGVPAPLPSDYYQFPCTSTRMYAEAGPGTYRYYVNVLRASGADPTLNVAGTYIRAKYYPTAYGSIVVKSSDNESTPRALGIPSDGTKPVGDLNLKILTLQEINAKLEADRAALRAENERLKKEKATQAEAIQKLSPN